jgi:predicted nucleic acid-binding Zn ribbon protein
MRNNLCRSGVLVAVFLFAGLPAALGQVAARVQGDTLTYRLVPAEYGEHCLICGMQLTADDVALIYRGRRVPLKRAMVEQFLQDPDRYFFKLEPRAALFDEHAVVRRRLQTGWLVVGFAILTSLLFAGLSAHQAVRKGLQPVPWFFAGLAFNAFGYLMILTRKGTPGSDVPEGWAKVRLTAEPVHCRNCGAEIHPSARRCPFCGRETTPVVSSEVERVGLSPRSDSDVSTKSEPG